VTPIPFGMMILLLAEVVLGVKCEMTSENSCIYFVLSTSVDDNTYALLNYVHTVKTLSIFFKCII
jgi:hypothetical protein